MNRDEFERAATRLRLRPSHELAGFVVSLLGEHTSGVGAYARAFAAPDCVAAARMIEDSIADWSHLHRHDTYHRAAAAAGHLDWILEAIERCLLPNDPEAAFRLIVRCFERDSAFGPDDLEEISSAFQRAAGLFRTASRACPPDHVQAEVKRLLAGDRSGYRALLIEEPISGPH